MTVIDLAHIEAVKNSLPEEAKDLKLNLSGVFNCEYLNEDQVWGILLTAAYFIKDEKLAKAFETDAVSADVDEAVISDAKAAASIMGMNTVYYRFRHTIDKETYNKKPARLRMQRMMRPTTSKVNFELNSTSAAILLGCQMCINAHEASVIKEGLSEEHVHDVARITAIVHGVSIALGIGK
ncbi:carboxymuconolactone decarboxylase family protein [Planctomycetota bacterium]|nr:carboxymuconolactone decarboxylase family protein [Planctomycetota bacterium]